MASPTGVESDTDLIRADWRPPDFSSVQEFLTLLAKAVHQFRTYPATSPLCTSAIAAAHEALLTLRGREQLQLRVGSSQLVLDDAAPLGGPVIEQELVRRLRRAQVASVEISRGATIRELSRFCSLLGEYASAQRATDNFAELLVERGVAGIAVRGAQRPVVVEAGTPDDLLRQLVEHERQRRRAQLESGGPLQHLYPPEKGWVFVDPSAEYDSFSLVDLAVLVHEPAEIALAIQRLADDDQAAAIDPAEALTAKFSDLARLFGAVEPQLSQLLFSRLSRAVLSLDTERRTSLLRSTVLPGLLDANLDGAVLANFPDLDLADALCLLLDIETTMPEVLGTALDRLQLPAERREALAPALAERLQQRRPAADKAGNDLAIERYARQLIDVAPADSRSFSEYAAFDLSVTDQTRTALSRIAQVITETDAVRTQLETACRLIRLEPNPVIVTECVGHMSPLLAALGEQRQWAVVGEWGGRLRDLAAAGRDSRPDAADAVLAGLQAFCTPRRLAALASGLSGDGSARADAAAFLAGFGEVAATAVITGLGDPDVSTMVQRLVPLLGEQASAFAPALTTLLPSATGEARLAIIRVLGEAGAAHGPRLAALLKLDDEATTREVLRALVRIGTSAAAAAVAGQLTTGAEWRRTAALEALLSFPAGPATGELRKLLANRAFVVHHPETVSRLLDRLGGADGLEPVLTPLVSWRFHFWNPGLRRLALKAQRLLPA